MMQWLMKYPLQTWQEGKLAFANEWPLYLLLLAVGLVLIVNLVTLIRQPLSAARKSVVFSLQTIAATVLILMLWQPVLKVDVAEQGENTVAWLVDTSQSMQTVDVPRSSITTADPQSRLEAAAALIEDMALDTNAEFDPVLYSLGDELGEIATSEQLFDQPVAALSRLGDGLEDVLGTVGQSSLAAVVLISDDSSQRKAIHSPRQCRPGSRACVFRARPYCH